MSLVQHNRLEIKLGSYCTATASALTDPLYHQIAQEYRRALGVHMIPLDADDIKKRLPPCTYHVSRKVDGEFSLLVYVDGEAITVNPGGTVRVGLPMLAEAALQFKAAGIQKAVIAGELYFVHDDGKRPRVHDVSRAARQPQSQSDLDSLHFAAFDIIEIDGKPAPEKYEDTAKQLTKIFGKGERVCNIEGFWAKSAGDVEKYFEQWVTQGAEGAVVRSEAAGLFKIKPRHTIDAVVIGFTEGTDDRHGMLHDLLLALMRADGTLHIIGRVGGGFTNDERREFLSDLKDMVVPSDYVEVNEQIAYRMVRPEWVIEVSILDVISQSTRGASINKMVLYWNPDLKKFEVVRRLPMVGLISPQFVRKRDDKTVNPHDLRIQQITDIVEVGMTDRDARQLSLNKSQILKREVFTKVMKGQTMVRKLVMWKTNKELESEDFPAYVIHYTDFSPNRKTPLDRELRVSNFREQIDELWQVLYDENLTKGWTKVAGLASPEAEPAAKPIEAPPATAISAQPAPKKRASKKAAEPEAAAPPPPAEPEVAPAPKPKAKTTKSKKSKSDEE
jgi:hypothetical protein